jgi:hypothetical protein
MPIEGNNTAVQMNQYGERQQLDNIQKAAPVSSSQPVSPPEQYPTTPTGEPALAPDAMQPHGEPLTADDYNDISAVAPWMSLVQSNPTPEIEDLVKEIIEVKKSEYGNLSRPNEITNNGLDLQQTNNTTQAGENWIPSQDQLDAVTANSQATVEGQPSELPIS